MTPTPIGYFPKRTSKDVAWLETPGVEEICSVSAHMSKGPEDWINHWQHNAMWVFDSPDVAWSVLPLALRNEFDLYFYRMYPVRFVHGQQEPFEIPKLAVEPADSHFRLLGFDPVSRTYDNDFECSPLSCNRIAAEIPVNKWCLLENADQALKIAKHFSEMEPEPGPYYLVEVSRQESRSLPQG